MGGACWGCPEAPLSITFISVGATSGLASLTMSQAAGIHCVASLSFREMDLRGAHLLPGTHADWLVYSQLQI